MCYGNIRTFEAMASAGTPSPLDEPGAFSPPIIIGLVLPVDPKASSSAFFIYTPFISVFECLYKGDKGGSKKQFRTSYCLIPSPAKDRPRSDMHRFLILGFARGIRCF